MSYTDVFGGELIFPSQLSYLAITTAVDVTLQWPTEQQITGDNVVADVMDVTTSVASLNIDMPDARNTSEGNKTTFNNVGGEIFNVRDNTGGTIQTVQPGEQWVLVLTDNTTDAGTWTTFLLGGNAATPASASVLAGAGLRADGAQLSQKIDSDEESATPLTVVDGDRAKCLIYVGGAGQADLPAAAGVGNDWFFMLRNSGSGTLTIVPASGEIDGSPNLALDTNSSCFIFTDGTDWFTIGLTASSTIAFDFVSLPIPGSGDFVLSGANLDRISYRFTGALTGDRKVVVPDTTQQYWCDNQTSGAFTLTIGTNAQASPPTLDPGQTAIMYSNSIEVIDAVNAVSVMFPIQISQGGTGATNAADARTNLDVPSNSEVVPVTRTLTAGDALNGGGDLSADRTFDVQAGLGLDIPGGVEVALDLTNDRNRDHGAIDLIAGLGINPAGLGDITISRTIAAFLASTTQEGVLETATQGEADAGVLDNKIMTPLKVANLPAAGAVYTVTTGTFVPIWTGFAVPPTLTVRWTRLSTTVVGASDIAVLRFTAPGLPTGTSNAITMTITNIPGAITPAAAIGGSESTFHAQIIDNGSLNVIGNVSVGFTGTMVFRMGRDSGIAGTPFAISPNGFTAAGVKGISQQTLLIYLLS